MKNLYKLSSEKKNCKIYKSAETSNNSSEEFHEDFVREHEGKISIGNFEFDAGALANIFLSMGLDSDNVGSFVDAVGTADKVISDESNDADIKSEKTNKTTHKRSIESIKFSDNILVNAQNFIGFNEKDNPEFVKECHKSGGLPGSGTETAWCASFTSYALQKSGVKVQGSARARDWLNKGVSIQENELKKGDLIVFARGKNPDEGHTGFFTGEYEGKYPIIIAGNVGNEVKIYPEKEEILGCQRFG